MFLYLQYLVWLDGDGPENNPPSPAAIAVGLTLWLSWRQLECCVCLSHRLLSTHSNTITITCRLAVYPVQAGGRPVSKHMPSSSRFLAGFTVLNYSL